MQGKEIEEIITNKNAPMIKGEDYSVISFKSGGGVIISHTDKAKKIIGGGFDNLWNYLLAIYSEEVCLE